MDGWLVVDKPQGISSNRYLGFIKRLLGVKKAGFAGTLDPMASGVLPVAVGKATKVIEYLMVQSKGYFFDVEWGIETDTLDITGEIVKKNKLRPQKNDIQDILDNFIGKINQIPPVYSAVKVAGRRLCDLARKGKLVIPASRKVCVHKLELLSCNIDTASFYVECGSGTYVRSIARDIAIKLDTIATTTMIRRSFVGPFNLKQAVNIKRELLDDASYRKSMYSNILNLDIHMFDTPELLVSYDAKQRLINGLAVSINDIVGADSLTIANSSSTLILNKLDKNMSYVVRVYDNEGILALGFIKDGFLHPCKLLRHTKQGSN